MKHTQKNIHIFFSFLNTWDSSGKWGPLIEGEDPSNLLHQHYGCWWPGDARSQGSISRGIEVELVFLAYYSFRKISVRMLKLEQNSCHWEDNIFKLMKMWVFQLKFHLSVFPKVKSTMVRVIVWQHVTSHYLGLWCPRSMTPWYHQRWMT